MSFDIVCLSKVDVLSNADCIVLEDHCRFFANSCVHESLQIVCIWTIYRAWFHELIISGCKPMIRCIFYTDVYNILAIDLSLLSCWVIDLNHISSRIPWLLWLVMMIKCGLPSTILYSDRFMFWIIDIVYICPQLVPWASKIIAARILQSYQTMALRPNTFVDLSYQSLLHSVMPYISVIAVLYPYLDGVPWPLCRGSYHTLNIH